MVFFPKKCWKKKIPKNVFIFFIFFCQNGRSLKNYLTDRSRNDFWTRQTQIDTHKNAIEAPRDFKKKTMRHNRIFSLQKKYTFKKITKKNELNTPEKTLNDYFTQGKSLPNYKNEKTSEQRGSSLFLVQLPPFRRSFFIILCAVSSLCNNVVRCAFPNQNCVRIVFRIIIENQTTLLIHNAQVQI